MLAGFPVVDVKIKAVDGSYHDVDSNEMAFKIAGSMAFKEGFKKANPVTARADHEGRGRYSGRLHGRCDGRPYSSSRPDLQGTDDTPSGKVINAMVPLGEMFGYATSLRSMSQGRATFTMEFDHYAEAPSNIAEPS